MRHRRPTRSTRRRDTPPPIPTAVGGLAVVLLLVILGWQALGVYDGVPLRRYATVYVATPQVGNLLSHDPVRIAGARVGQVLGRDVGPDGHPRIQLQIEPGTTLPSDTTVAVRGAGLLGARYVELIPGRSRSALPDGAVIKGDDSSYAYGLPEALDTFDARTRSGLRRTLGALGQGFATNGEGLNDGIHAAGTQAGPFGEFAAEVLGREGAAGRLLPALESAVRPLDADRHDLADLTGVVADAVQPLVDRRAQVRATLDAAPSALAALQPGLTEGTRLLASLRAAATVATQTLPEAPAGLRSLTGLLTQSTTPLDRTQKLLVAAEPAVPAALRLTSALSPVLSPVRKLLADASQPLHEISRYSCDIVNFGQVMRSMTGYTQPGSGPLGPAQAFRLQLVLPVSTAVAGVRDSSGRNTRAGIEPPCTYLASSYPQFIGAGR